MLVENPRFSVYWTLSLTYASPKCPMFIHLQLAFDEYYIKIALCFIIAKIMYVTNTNTREKKVSIIYILYYETSYQIGLLLSVIVQNQILPSLHFPLDFFFSFLPPLVLTTLAAHFKKQAFLYVFPSLPHTCFFFFGHFFVHSVIKNNDVKL